MRKFEQFLEALTKLYQSTKTIQEISMTSQLLKDLAQHSDPDVNLPLIQIVEERLTFVQETSKEFLRRLKDFTAKVGELKQVEVTEEEIRASHILKEIKLMLDSQEFGPDFDKRLQDKTNEYLTFRKAALRGKRSKRTAHKLAETSQ